MTLQTFGTYSHTIIIIIIILMCGDGLHVIGWWCEPFITNIAYMFLLIGTTTLHQPWCNDRSYTICYDGHWSDWWRLCTVTWCHTDGYWRYRCRRIFVHLNTPAHRFARARGSRSLSARLHLIAPFVCFCCLIVAIARKAPYITTLRGKRVS